MLRRLIGKSSEFGRDKRGNFAVMTGFALIPIVGFLGYSVDYGVALSIKAKMDLAADAAALTAITSAQDYYTTHPTLTSTQAQAAAKDQGETQAAKAFLANSGGMPFGVTPSTSTVVTRVGQTITATSIYTVNTPTTFARVLGVNTIPVQGSTTTSLTMPSYIDFYMLLDMSGSMGLPSTPAGTASMMAISPDLRAQSSAGCAFACHFPGSQSFDLSRAVTNPRTAPPRIQLRADAVQNAVTAVLNQAKTTATLPSQYRVGLYPFIQHMMPLYPISTDIDTAITKNSTLVYDWLDQGVTYVAPTGTNPTPTAKYMGSGGTHFDNVLPEMNTAVTVTTPHDGSASTNPKPFVFFVTDGMNDTQTYAPFNGSSATSIDSTKCDALKAKGVTVSVLYIPYLTVSDLVPVNLWGNEVPVTNAAIPSLSAGLRGCATPGYFYTADTPVDIANAMQAMFAQAVQSAHITN